MLAVAAIALLAIALRVHALGADSLWFDEGWTWWLTSLAPGQMLDVIRGDVMAPLYFYLLKGWRVAVGDVSEAGLRMPSAFCAVLTLAPFYALARASLRTHAARLAACALMAIALMQLQYAREARPYALLCLMTLTAAACVPTLAARRSWPAMMLFALCVAAGLYTHNMMLFNGLPLAIAWGVWPGARRMRGRMIDMAVAGAIVLICYLPWLPVLRAQARSIDGTFWAARPDARAAGIALAAVAGIDVYGLPAIVWELFRKPFTAELAMGLTCGGVLVAILVAAAERGRRRVVAAVAALVLGPMLLVFLFSQVGQPIFLERAFIASSATMPILFAIAVDGSRIWRRGVGAAATATVGLMMAGSSLCLFTHPQKEDWRGAYAYVASLPASPTRLIVFVANEGQLPFDFYVSRDPSRVPETRTGAPAGFFGIYPPRTIRTVTRDDDLDAFRALLVTGGYDEVVFVFSHDAFSDPGGRTERLARTTLTPIDERTLRSVRILRCHVPPAAAASADFSIGAVRAAALEGGVAL